MNTTSATPLSPSPPAPSAPILPPPEYDSLPQDGFGSNVSVNNGTPVTPDSYEDDVALAIAMSMQERESIAATVVPTPQSGNIVSSMWQTSRNTIAVSVIDDAQIAKRIHQEERDSQIARGLQEREDRRIEEMQQSGPLRGTVIEVNESSHSQQGQNCRRRFCNFSIMCAVLAGGALLVLFYGPSIWEGIGGDPNDLPDFFQDNWDDNIGNGTSVGDFSRWQNKGNGLRLTLVNALTPDWDVYFNEAVKDWDKTPALHLSTTTMDPDSECVPISGKMKVCNAEYGLTSWTGLNEVYFEGRGSFIVSSVAKMNESYLKRSSAGEHQYVMCHELGHGFGLPHRDENTNNPDLGTCLDYTRRPEENMRPDEQDYSNLAEIYGTRRALGISLLRTRNKEDTSRFQRIVSQKRSYKEGRLLHQSGRKEVYETILGGDIKLITTVLLAT